MRKDQVARERRHWANRYIGRTYESCGGCWGFVRLVFAEEFAVAMPQVAVGEESVQAPAILAASQASGYLRAPLPPREHDILLMRGADGERHVGIAVSLNAVPGLLHCVAGVGVHWTPLTLLHSAGYTALEPWRLPA